MPRIPLRDQAAALLRHTRSATPFTSQDGQPCASLPGLLDSRSVVPIRSAAFRDWLTNQFYSEFEMVPSQDAFRGVLRTLEARARYTDFPVQQLDHRVGFEGDPYAPSKIILDLANPSGEVVEMDSHGWRIRDNLHHSFRQSITTLALPRPLAPSNGHSPLDRFAQLFGLNESDRARVLAWLVNALRPVGPYPILVLQGPPASGRTTLARALRTLIDPAPALVRRLPDRDDELRPYAFENWFLAFDDSYRIAGKITDALCALSAGDAYRISQPDSRDTLEIQLARPILLIAPQDEGQSAWIPPRALSHRTLAVHRPPIRRLIPERTLWSEFESLRPAMLAALAHAVVTALHRFRDIDLASIARFPDAAIWCAAAAPALDLTERAAIQAITDGGALWAGSDPLRNALRAIIAPGAAWTGEAADLLNQLRLAAPIASLPATPKGLSQLLPGIPGFRIDRTRTGAARTLTITRLADVEQESAAGHMNRS